MIESTFLNRDGSLNGSVRNEQDSVRVVGRDYLGGPRKLTRLAAVNGERRIYKDDLLIVSTLSRKKFKRYASRHLATFYGCSRGLPFR